MRILIVYRGIHPNYSASSKRLGNYLRALQAENHEANVLSVYFKTHSGIIEFILSFIIPFLAFTKVLRHIKSSSVVFIYGPGWIFKFSIICASKLFGKPVGTELNEKPYSIYGDGIRDLFLQRFDTLNEFCLKRIVYPYIDGFLVISEPLVKYTTKYGKKGVTVCKVPILVDFEYFQKQIKKPDCDYPYLLHSAALNDHKDGIVNVFQAFADVIKKGFKLHFYLTSKIGSPRLIGLINSIIKENQLNDMITFLGELNEEDLLAFQAHCSMVVVNKVNSDQNQYNFATKLGEYMALGKPVITTEFGEVKLYLEDKVSCLYVNPLNPNDISTAIIRILEDSSFSKKIGEEGRKIAKANFDIIVQSGNVSKFFKSLIKE